MIRKARGIKAEWPHTQESDLDVARQGFVDGVDLLEGVDAAGRGLDVDDGVREGDVLGEAVDPRGMGVRDRSIMLCVYEVKDRERGRRG